MSIDFFNCILIKYVRDLILSRLLGLISRAPMHSAWSWPRGWGLPRPPSQWRPLLAGVCLSRVYHLLGKQAGVAVDNYSWQL